MNERKLMSEVQKKALKILEENKKVVAFIDPKNKNKIEGFNIDVKGLSYCHFSSLLSFDSLPMSLKRIDDEKIIIELLF